MEIYHKVNFKYFNTLKINNIVDYLFVVKDVNEIFILVYLFREFEIDYVVIGNGSKVLLNKYYFHKPIILIKEQFSTLEIKENNFIVSAGYKLNCLISKLSLNNISCFESLYPIPGCLGGAIYMNAGNKKECISDNIERVICLSKKGELLSLDNIDCCFSYRNSLFKTNDHIILYAVFKYQKKSKELINKTISEAINYRKEHQDMYINTCGSLFKNPKGYYAYELIQKTFQDGIKINDCQISKKHFNFLENLSDAKVHDVLKLIKTIKKEVYKKFNIKLELELNIVE